MDRILLLGHGKKVGMALAAFLADIGYSPLAAGWDGFTPRAYGRGEHPKLLIADFEQSDAMPPADLCALTRKYWGESFPVIAVSRSGKFAHISDLVDSGVADVMPFGGARELLERKIQRCLAATVPDMIDMTEEIPDDLLGVFLANNSLVPLGDLATVYGGVAPRRSFWRRMAPPDDGWKGVITSETLDRFHVGKPTSYLSWSRLHLFRLPPAEEYSVLEKVVLRRAGPPLSAAVDRSRLPAGADAYSVIPAEGVGAGYLACVLNSRVVDFYYNRIARLGGDGRLRLADVRTLPIPPADAQTMAECARIATLLAHFGPNPQGWIDRQSKDELWERMEEIVFSLYGVGAAARESLEAMCF